MNGGNIYDLQKILGHTSLEMTQRYAHLAPEHLVQAANVVSFGANIKSSALIAPQLKVCDSWKIWNEKKRPNYLIFRQKKSQGARPGFLKLIMVPSEGLLGGIFQNFLISVN